MSTTAAADFLSRVRADSEIRSRLGPNPSPESYLAEASRFGIDFSLEQLRGAVNAESFYQKAIDDPALYERLSAMSDSNSVVAMAKELGFECPVEALEAVLHPHNSELSEAEMESVTGGRLRGMGTTPNVCKVPAPPAPFAPIPYPNIGKIKK